MLRFQPTLPARGATRWGRRGGVGCHFNPRSPHGERRTTSTTQTRWRTFQPTLPARGATDALGGVQYSRENVFQPTLPARGATLKPKSCSVAMAISTHAPRTGSDCKTLCRPHRTFVFQPTLPARGATIRSAKLGTRWIFQPTLPARGATCEWLVSAILTI